MLTRIQTIFTRCILLIRSVEYRSRLSKVWSRTKSILATLSHIGILLGVISFLQGQKPLIDRRVDHSQKTITFTNKGILPLPIRTRLFSVEFFLNDMTRDVVSAGDYIKSVNATAFPVAVVHSWPFFPATIRLKDNPRFKFEPLVDNQPFGNDAYCLVAESQSWLGNETDVDVFLTDRSIMPGTFLGPMPVGAGFNGPLRTIIAARDIVESQCKAIYEQMK